MIKAVVFDLDNTIYNYDECHIVAMKQLEEYVCDKYGVNKVDFRKNFELAKVEVKKLLGNTGASHNRMLYMQIFLEKINQSPVEDALELYDIYWRAMLEKMTPFKYVMPLMKQLKHRKIEIGILTDLTAHIQHRKIKKLCITEYIDAIVTSEEVGAEKPSSIAFSRIIQKLHCNPEEILMIGDSQKKDIDGAVNVGMRGMLFLESYKDTMDERVMDSNDLEKERGITVNSR